MNSKKYTAAYKLCIFSTVILSHTTFLGMDGYNLKPEKLDLNKTVLENFTILFKVDEEYQNHLKKLQNPAAVELMKIETDVMLEYFKRQEEGIEIEKPIKKRAYVSPSTKINSTEKQFKKINPTRIQPKRVCKKKINVGFYKEN